MRTMRAFVGAWRRARLHLNSDGRALYCAASVAVAAKCYASLAGRSHGLLLGGRQSGRRRLVVHERGFEGDADFADRFGPPTVRWARRGVLELFGSDLLVGVGGVVAGHE